MKNYSNIQLSSDDVGIKDLSGLDFKDPPVVATCARTMGNNTPTDMPRYIVRRLTPTECAALQGFPTDWCSSLETPEPTEEEADWWYKVFETHQKILGKSSRPRSRKQVIKWLRDPYSDAAEYKLWGNGVTLSCVCFVLAGIAWSAKKEASQEVHNQQNRACYFTAEE